MVLSEPVDPGAVSWENTELVKNMNSEKTNKINLPFFINKFDFELQY